LKMREFPEMGKSLEEVRAAGIDSVSIHFKYDSEKSNKAKIIKREVSKYGLDKKIGFWTVNEFNNYDNQTEIMKWLVKKFPNLWSVTTDNPDVINDFRSQLNAHKETERLPPFENLMNELGQIPVAFAKDSIYLVINDNKNGSPIEAKQLTSEGISQTLSSRWTYTTNKQIRLQDYNKCMTVKKNNLVLEKCEKKRRNIIKTQKYSYKYGWLKIGSRCVQVEKNGQSFDVVLKSCSYNLFGVY